MPWNMFGRDFGGDVNNRRFFRRAFAEMVSMDIRSARIWIHGDGRGSPRFEAYTMMPLGVSDAFMTDFGMMLDLAAQYGIGIIPTLWSFDMVKDRTEEYGPFAGVHWRLIADPTYTRAYIDRVLIPLVERFDNHPALYAWEIINEPEWMAKDHGVRKSHIQRFVGMQAAAIHRAGDKPVTVGSASLRYNAEPPIGAGNWWSDAALLAATGDPDAKLDFYQIHVYGWMLEHGWSAYAYSVEELGLDKPVMIGEAPASGIEGIGPDGERISIPAWEMLEKAKELGYFAHYFWSLRGHDGMGGRTEVRTANRKAFAPPNAIDSPKP